MNELLSMLPGKAIIFRSMRAANLPISRGWGWGSLALLLALNACYVGRRPPGEAAPQPSVPSPLPAAPATTLPGADSPRGAVERFFQAVKAQDLQAMAMAWGTPKGPAAQNMERDELERRELIMLCYFSNDSYTIPEESSVGQDGQRVFRVALSKGTLRAQPAVYTVQGPGGRWYVQNLEIAAVRDFCPQQK